MAGCRIPHFQHAWRGATACAQQAQSNFGRGGGIRTPGPLVPNQMRYQAALRPDSADDYPTPTATLSTE